jgi:hypothetical protein
VTEPGTGSPSGGRPLSVTLIGVLFVAAGIVGLAHHVAEFEPWVLVLRVLAIVAGGFILLGADWARWLALGWVAYHVVVGAFHSWSEALAHVVVLAGCAVALLHPRATAYFRRMTGPPEQPAA